MSRKSDCGRQSIAYDLNRHGLQRTPCEKKRFIHAKAKKRIQRIARKVNRGK